MGVPVFAGAAETAQALRDGKFSAIELLENLLARIDRYNPELNALVTIDRDGARQRAREADQALARGEVWGPLHGLPVTIKDAFETRGLRSTDGQPALANHIPQQDAAAVMRLRAAGAIILGKTNLPPLTMDFQTDNPIFGRTNNPWDLSRTCGGSTGGGAAAVAAGLSYLELGSDLAGSLRIPAHFCGVCSIAPTDGRVPRDGHLPRQSPGMTVGHFLRVGLVARSVADLQLGLPVLAGPLAIEPDLPPVSLAEPRYRELNRLRIAWTDAIDGLPVSAATRTAIQEFTQKISAAGCQVERAVPTGFDFKLAGQVHNRILMTALAAQLPTIPRVLARYLGKVQAFDLDLKKYLKAETQRAALSAAMDEFLAGWDAWICPVTAIPAYPHHLPSGKFGDTPLYNKPLMVDDQPVDYFAANSNYTISFNVGGQPVVVLPVSQSPEGLPIGVQVVGRCWSDMELLSTAASLFEITGPLPHPPRYVD